MLFIFIIFLFIFIFSLKKKSLVTLFSGIVTASLFGSFFLGRKLEIENGGDLMLVFFILFLLLSIILPWKDYYGVKQIIGIGENKLRVLQFILIPINIFVFIILLITTIVVLTTVSDINEFKYAEGVSQEFYYNFLPFNVSFFNIAILVYYFAYFMLPLHFYYLYKKNSKLALLYFVLSLNIVLYGLTFFSRAVLIHYIFLYFGFLWLLYGALSSKTKRSIKMGGLVISGIGLLYFISVSVQRFEEDENLSKIYYKNIPVEAPIQDPVLYSYLDYSSQWAFNGYEVMKLYGDEYFAGQITFQPINSILSQFGIGDYEYFKYWKYRAKLWPKHYSYSFNGYPAYTLYDYGVFGSIIFSLLFVFIVRKNKPKNGSLSLLNLFVITLIIQLPLLAIFYSQMGGIIIPVFLLIPIYLFSKYKLRI